MRGDGRLFLRGSVYWASFYVDGKEQRESTKKTDREEAEKYLRKRLKQKHAHEGDGTAFITRRDCRSTVANLMDALAAELRLRGKGSMQTLSTIKQAREIFGHWRALALTRDANRPVDTFIQKWLDAGYAPATINRRTQVLHQAYKLAKLPAPEFVRLDESGNVRRGFFEAAEFRAVLANLADEDVRDFVLAGYLTGWRKGELSSLKWEDVEGDLIRLRAENSKNGRARSVPIEGELADLMERRRVSRQYKRGKVTAISAFVFHRRGEPIREFRKSWSTACIMVGLGKLVCPGCGEAVDAEHRCATCDRKWKREDLRYRGRIFHDLRRTAVRDMVRAHVPQGVAMSLSGHRTASMFSRYNITDAADQRRALLATQDLSGQPA